MINHRVPELIVCDVDGTLIDPSEALTPAFDELHDLIKRNGLRFTLASGRSTDQLRKYLDKLEIIEPVIINNGGGARQNGAPLWDELLDPLCIKRAVLEADKLDMAIFMCDGDHETAYRHNAYIQREIDVFGRYNHFYIPLESEWETLRLEKVMITDPQKPGRVDAILQYLTPYVDCLNVIRYDDRHLDIMKQGVTKGGAVERIARFLNVPLGDIMAVGDGANDIEMMQKVGLAVSVANASPVLKAHMDYSCQESYTYGVIEAIKKFCI